MSSRSSGELQIEPTHTAACLTFARDSCAAEKLHISDGCSVIRRQNPYLYIAGTVYISIEDYRYQSLYQRRARRFIFLSSFACLKGFLGTISSCRRCTVL